ncbi:class I SAM-dependent methyltransferase [Paraburkholderia sp. Tr-20389]|uniref:class I SAM-dependent methyltransferase n=1 Tax=Paraburkholderia sp. Tr-20389 TaxID=2703903 RepID=UPI001980B2A2|nr:class I SAM-dependent methyltransferase [Paraburkholderia sp. Tr-20389]MBN3751758.1 class I SAM-dependent methyltransferase [Paraburkholderia sp. Tr-20389]
MYATRLDRARAVTIAATFFALTLTGCTSSMSSQDASRESQPQGAGATSLGAAVNGPQRSPQARARDVYRHPEATLQFFDLGPAQAVLEIAPGGGWYTDILAPYLHDAGQLYEAQYLSTSSDLAAEDSATDAAYRRKLAKDPSVYGKVVVGTLHAGQFNGFDANSKFDRVLTFRNIHNWIKDGQLDANLHAFYGALKRGGTLGVEEHRARPGTTKQQMIDSGYVTEAFVIEHAQAAGFVLMARSEINANPKDTKDYPHGVWSLPPTYQGGDADRSRFAAIGESDRMTLKFVKP